MQLSLKEDVNSLSFFKANFNQVLQKIKNNHRPLVITQNGRATGIFMDIETWESQLKKINLFKLVNEGEVSLKTSKTHSLKDVGAYFDKKYAL